MTGHSKVFDECIYTMKIFASGSFIGDSLARSAASMAKENRCGFTKELYVTEGVQLVEDSRLSSKRLKVA